MIKELLMAGLLALEDYIAKHVITCLIPAFLLAGAMVTFIDKSVIIKYLGSEANKIRSFSLASISSFLLAACSCTVIPVASGLYYTGASIGVAFIILWVAPAANILALIYTGAILGTKMVLSRIVSALLMAFIVGWIMVLVFERKSKESLLKAELKAEFGEKSILPKKYLILIILILLSLLSPNYLVRSGPYWHKVLV